MTTRKQSLKTALKNPAIRRALNGLVGCPAGGWGETAQAVRQLMPPMLESTSPLPEPALVTVSEKTPGSNLAVTV